jgi:hypothetical protein
MATYDQYSRGYDALGEPVSDSYLKPRPSPKLSVELMDPPPSAAADLSNIIREIRNDVVEREDQPTTDAETEAENARFQQMLEDGRMEQVWFMANAANVLAKLAARAEAVPELKDELETATMFMDGHLIELSKNLRERPARFAELLAYHRAKRLGRPYTGTPISA